jgi:hypothetical protein
VYLLPYVTKEDNNKKVATDFLKHPENIKMHWSTAYIAKHFLQMLYKKITTFSSLNGKEQYECEVN